ncbi:protein kinase family protein [Vibrio pectenicida]|uniref:Protein kinase family protein n=1 Tax=Vibrio pectenicida TaxID=62763 RepID=A0A7Y4EBU8_9VIBR|nr:protein kinase [Vibrio pectenicida]NOH70010.1 protein kinase family protein [Vibrio pectenicida]
MNEQTGLGDKVTTVFRVLGISQYSLLYQQTYLTTHPCHGPSIVKFAYTIQTKQQLKTEAEFLHRYRSLHWPKYLDYGSNSGIDWLILEFFDSLSDGVDNHDIDTKKLITNSAEQALSALHGKGYIHGDIKPSNIIITSERQVKLIDLGSIMKIGLYYQHHCNPSLTPKFCALNPYLRTGEASPQHDYFSLAISLQTMWQAHPFAELSLIDFVKTNNPAMLESLFSRYQILISKQIRYAQQLICLPLKD